MGRAVRLSRTWSGISCAVHAYVLAPTPPFLSDAPLLLLPGIALLARTQNAQSERVLSRTAQVFLLIGNAERAQRHEAPFVLRKVNDLGDGVHGLTATLPEWRKQTLPPTEYGIEPSLLFGFDHMVLASNLAAAQAMLLQVKNGAQQALSGDVLLLHGMPIAAAVEQSQRPLLLARMLDEGRARRRRTGFTRSPKGCCARSIFGVANARKRIPYELRNRTAAQIMTSVLLPWQPTSADRFDLRKAGHRCAAPVMAARYPNAVTWCAAVSKRRWQRCFSDALPRRIKASSGSMRRLRLPRLRVCASFAFGLRCRAGGRCSSE